MAGSTKAKPSKAPSGTGAKKPGRPGTTSVKDLEAAVRAKLATSLLSPEDAKRMGVRIRSAQEMAALKLPAGATFELPYFGLDGKPTGFRRWRYVEDLRNDFQRKAGAKQLRYVQLADSPVEAYFPPFADWRKIAKDPSVAVVFTEGELKAACVTRHIAPCIGLGGVYSFRSARLGQELLPELKDFKWEGRTVAVAFDSDSSRNPMVSAARTELCRRLTQLGAIPTVALVPDAADGTRQGVDDMAHAEGLDAVVEVLSAAEPFGPAEALHEMSSEVAYVRDPGMVVELATGLKMRASDFCNHVYSNRHYTMKVDKPDGGFKLLKVPTARAWLDWPCRLELKRMTYSPGEDRITAAGEMNTWRGWGVEPAPGDVTPWRELLDHLFGKGTPERAWFERWCAIPLQQPGAKMFTACAIWGRLTGTGKSSVAYCLKKIYGSNFTEIGDEELKDARNEWAIDKQFTLGDDVTGQEQRKHADRLKAMITRSEMRLNPKYVPSYTVPDRVNYLFTSNHPDAFFLEDDDRRFFVHEVTAPPLPDSFYEKLKEWRDSEAGAAALFHHLLCLDLAGQGPSDRALRTAAREAMIEDGLSDIGRWVRSLRDEPDAVLRFGAVKLTGDLWSGADLLRVYDPEGRGRATAGGMARELKRAGIPLAYKGMQVRTGKGPQRLFAVRNPERWVSCASGEASRHYDSTRSEHGSNAGKASNPLKKDRKK